MPVLQKGTRDPKNSELRLPRERRVLSSSWCCRRSGCQQFCCRSRSPTTDPTPAPREIRVGGGSSARPALEIGSEGLESLWFFCSSSVRGGGYHCLPAGVSHLSNILQLLDRLLEWIAVVCTTRILSSNKWYQIQVFI